ENSVYLKVLNYFNATLVVKHTQYISSKKEPCDLFKYGIFCKLIKRTVDTFGFQTGRRVRI
uniref:hypothetical protein n=1 Tax=Ureibacillus thermosphaericus TaxID=51173 RepID=UPI001EE64EC1